MNFTNCLHPITVERHGVTHTVPCGKCEYCRFVRSLDIVNRFGLESQSHKYCVLITLTYANVFLPRIEFDKESNYFYVNDEAIFADDAGLCFPYHANEHDLLLLDKIYRNYGFIPRLRKYDVQTFLKRFRINVQRKLNLKHEKIIYLCCGEYGPKNYRPHYHCAMLFDSSELAKNFKMLLSSSWYFGSSRFRFATGKQSARYVAQYCTVLSCLPSFYQSKEISPFRLVSKSVPLGFSQISKEEIQRILIERSPFMLVRDNEKGKLVSLPLWRFLENKLFPKFPAYDYLPHWLRVRLIGYGADCTDFKIYEDAVLNIIRDEYDTFYKYSAVRDYFRLLLKEQNKSFYKRSSQIYSLWRCTRQIVKNIIEYGHSINVKSVAEYLSVIDAYYSNKERLQLDTQLHFENTFMSNHPDWLQFIDIGTQSSAVYDVPIVKQSIEKIHNIVMSSHKNKCLNEFVNAHPERSLIPLVDDFYEGFSPIY